MKLFDKKEGEADVKGKEKGKRNMQSRNPGRWAAAVRKVGPKCHESHAKCRGGGPRTAGEQPHLSSARVHR